MNTEEDEFNRIEREASMRVAAVKATVAKQGWIGLTDEQRINIWMDNEPGMVVLATEAMLKELNT